MRTFTIHSRPDRMIWGEDLVDAINEHLDQIAYIAQVGNAAGYRLDRVEASYATGILGGKGGVELIIKWYEKDLAHRPASQNIQTTVVWIYADPHDLPSGSALLFDASHGRGGEGEGKEDIHDDGDKYDDEKWGHLAHEEVEEDRSLDSDPYDIDTLDPTGQP